MFRSLPGRPVGQVQIFVGQLKFPFDVVALADRRFDELQRVISELLDGEADGVAARCVGRVQVIDVVSRCQQCEERASRLNRDF